MQDKIDNPDLENALRKSGIDEELEQLDEGPLYRKFQNAKIPVSKSMGILWESRIKQGLAARCDVETCWTEAIRYYEHDQLSHRDGGADGKSGNRRFQRRLGEKWSETENVVFSTVTSMLPMLYAKNPSVEVTATSQVHEEFAKTCEKLANTILSMKMAPGVNLKPKARRGVLWALLTNNAYMKVDFVKKAESSEQAILELEQLAEAYGNPKLKQKEIKEIEGKLLALEERVSILNPSGHKLKLVSPFRLVVDPCSTEPDHSDANWIAEMDFLQTDYMNAVYMQEKDGQRVSVYEPTHVLKPNAGSDEGVTDDLNNFSLFNKDKDAEAKTYGYSSTKAFNAAKYTKVWWIWDKTTRRLFLYADNQWKWPLWVWDDPLKLIEFFPYTHLWFHETVEGSQPKGEVTYYLDQQDAINDILSEEARARNWARMNVFYDKNRIKQDDVNMVLNGPDGTARGVDVEDGKSLKDVIYTLTPPSMQHPELFQTERKFAAINRISGVNEASRGAQFKTNTTNQAVNFYQQQTDIRLDEKIDLIEDWIGLIAWQIIQLAAMNMSVQDVAALIGDEHAKAWETVVTDPQQLRTRLNVRVVGGSTEKPTSKAKKKLALEIGQILGQFSGGAPAAVVVALKILSRAFADDIVITDEDWAMIIQSIQDNMNKAGGGPGEQGGGSPEDQLRQMVASLPPEKRKELSQLIEGGMKPRDALEKVTGGGQQLPPQQQPTK